MLKVYNSSNPQFKPGIVMLVYGQGGVGKTTFTSTAPKPLLADCEGGAKYFGLRGISMDIAQIKTWSDMQEFYQLSDKYETIVIDPLGELMDKLKTHMINTRDSKLVQNDGSPTMAGWGYLKKTMRSYIKLLRDSCKNVILVAHVEEKPDDGRVLKRPQLETKLSEEIVNIVDIVAYMTVLNDSEGKAKRVLMVDPESDKFVAKDRTGQLGRVVEPDFKKIVNACQGTETYSWSKKPKQEVKDKKEISKQVQADEMKDDPEWDLKNVQKVIDGEIIDEPFETKPRKKK